MSPEANFGLSNFFSFLYFRPENEEDFEIGCFFEDLKVSRYDGGGSRKGEDGRRKNETRSYHTSKDTEMWNRGGLGRLTMMDDF